MPGLSLRLMTMPRTSFRTKHAEDLTQTEVTPRLSFRLNHIAGIILPGNDEREKRARCVQNQSVSQRHQCFKVAVYETAHCPSCMPQEERERGTVSR